jgi:beta-xylosidase
MSISNIESVGSRPTYLNPVYPGYFADPFVWKHDGRYYAVGTGHEEAHGHVDAAKAGIFPMLASQDLIHWESIGRAMKKPEFGAAFGETFWAPEVAFEGGMFFLYYSVGRDDKGHHLRVATSPRPEGPYHDTGASLTSPEDWLFAIDPHPFKDDDGRWYLFFAADFLDAAPPGSGSVRAGTALVAQPLENMTALTGESRVILRARHDWQRFQADRLMYGRIYDWHTLEGPCVRKLDGRYYCFFSGGRWETERYGVDYAVADHVLGPYSDAGGEAGPRILKTVPGRVLGPGHNSMVEGPGGSTYIAYHAWDAGRTGRRLCIDPLIRSAEGPRSPGPTWTAQPLIDTPISPPPE